MCLGSVSVIDAVRRLTVLADDMRRGVVAVAEAAGGIADAAPASLALSDRNRDLAAGVRDEVSRFKID